ncbi:MAG: amidase [Alphaproteobacteria bacterium]|nr:amidase [Alphaproteobacteria bacterium]
MSFSEYDKYDGLGLAVLLDKGEISSRELLETAIERFETLNPVLNFAVERLFDQARNSVATESLAEGPFKGVPFIMKDLGGQMKGVRQTLGAKLFDHYISNVDSTQFERLRASGLNIFATTTTPEFGINFATETRLHGVTRNPWDLNRTPGGSSGGSAAALAAGVVPMAHASDGGGSIRVPAAVCGLVGLKPTRARNNPGPIFGEGWNGLAIEHALTRTVRDTAALLDCTAGPGIGDPYYAPKQERPFLDEVGAPTGKLRIAVSADNPFGVKPEKSCLEAMEKTAKLCASLGHQVEVATPTVNGDILKRANQTIVAANLCATLKAATLGRNEELQPDDVEVMTWAMHKVGEKISATDYISAVTALHGISRQVGTFFEGYDLLLTPTIAEPAPPIGHLSMMMEDGQEFGRRMFAFAPYTSLYNSTGQPAISLPLYWNEEDLPVGVQFVAKMGDEATLLRLSAQLEEALPWFDKRPTLKEA